ncbi:MAG: hypothetical protein V4710_20140 [Verrucomicrobiota bacterium]
MIIVTLLSIENIEYRKMLSDLIQCRDYTAYSPAHVSPGDEFG